MSLESFGQALFLQSIIINLDFITWEEINEWRESLYQESFEFHPLFNPLFSYYSSEMGKNLDRKIFISKNCFSREFIIQQKRIHQDQEESWSKNQCRQVNLDPGWLGLEQILLLTHKPYAHRIYLQNNLWAELCLIYSQKTWQDLPWTYPDYQDQEKKLFFQKARDHLKSSLFKASGDC